MFINAFLWRYHIKLSYLNRFYSQPTSFFYFLTLKWKYESTIKRKESVETNVFTEKIKEKNKNKMSVSA